MDQRSIIYFTIKSEKKSENFCFIHFSKLEVDHIFRDVLTFAMKVRSPALTFQNKITMRET